jgi:hypothetical protein
MPGRGILPVKLAFDLVFNRTFLTLPQSGEKIIGGATMTKISSCIAAVLCAFATQALAQGGGFQPVTSSVLANPPPGDWLMINRT